MLLKVIAQYRDRFTDEIHHIGEIVEADDKRGAELLAGGWVEAAEKPKPTAKRKKGVKDDA